MWSDPLLAVQTRRAWTSRHNAEQLAKCRPVSVVMPSPIRASVVFEPLWIVVSHREIPFRRTVFEEGGNALNGV